MFETFNMGRKILFGVYLEFFLSAILKDELFPALVAEIENGCGDNKDSTLVFLDFGGGGQFVPSI